MRINVLSREAITAHNKAVHVGTIGDAEVVALIDDYGKDSNGTPTQHWNLHVDIGGRLFYRVGQGFGEADAVAKCAAMASKFVELGFTANLAGVRAWLVANLREQWNTYRAVDGALIPWGCSRFVMTHLEIVDAATWDARRVEDDATRAAHKAAEAKKREERKTAEAAAALAAVNATAEALAAGHTAKITAVVAAVKHHQIDAHPRTLAALAAGRRTDGVDALLRAVADLAPSRVAAAVAHDEAIEAENRAAGVDVRALFRAPA